MKLLIAVAAVIAVPLVASGAIYAKAERGQDVTAKMEAQVREAQSGLDRTWTKSEVREAVVGKSKMAVEGLIGVPQSVHDGINPGTEGFYYHPLNHPVYDDTTGQAAQFMVVTFNADGVATDIQF